MSSVPPPASQPQIVYVESRSNGSALASVILGVLGIFTGGLLAILFWFSWILGLIGLILGFVGLAKAKKIGVRRTMAKWGIALSILALASGVYGAVVTANAVNDISDSLDKSSQEWDSYSQCIDQAETVEAMSKCD
jgi:hypothetical protein